MTKKIDGGTVVIKGKADLKDIIQEGNKASGALDKTKKSAQSADRQLKGAARASSGASKNFSKMSQGITGGLVPAYATLAANLFALDAVFRFLKNSADFRVLKEGQLAFAAATGVAYQSLARDLQTATRGMINFRDAAQAGAIGRAAGLSAGQLKELSEAAFTVSVALGRDVTDSFNRLVRGVTKAEPELLDELGIVLRLEEATTKYAAALGLNKNQLSIYQKSQAVVNEVLDQAETKFGKINAIMEPQANSITQLGVAFEEAIDAMRPAIAAVAEFVASFGKKNIDVLILAILGFAGGIINSVIPATHELRAAQEAQAAAYEQRLERLRIKQEELRQSKIRLANTPIAQQNLVGELDRQGVMFGGQIGADLKEGKSLSGQQIGNLKSQMKRNVGVFKGMSDAQKGTVGKILEDMKKDGGKMSKSMRLSLQQAGVELDIFKEKAGTFGERVSGFFAKAGRGVLAFMSTVGMLLAVASVLFMIGKAIRNFIMKDTIARTEKFNEKLKEQTTSLERINGELTKMAEVSRKGLLSEGAESDIFLGNALESADLDSRIVALGQLAEQADLNQEGFAKFQQELRYTFQNLADMDERFDKFAQAMAKTGEISKELRDELKEISESILTVKAAQDTLNQTSGELIKAQNRLTQGLPKVPYQDIIELLHTNKKAYTDLVNEGKDYELHLQRTTNQLKVFEIMQKAGIKLQKEQIKLDIAAAGTFLKGDPQGDRQLKVKQAELNLEKEMHKLNELQLQIQTAQLDGDDAKLKMLMQQRELQVDMIEKADNLLMLEKARADVALTILNDVYGGIERDLGQAIGAAMRGDSSGFAKIGENMTKTITDGIGKKMSEDFLADITPDFLKPKTLGDEIKEAGNKHAEAVKEAIKEGAQVHGSILKGENSALNQILDEQKRINALIADKDAEATQKRIDKIDDQITIAEKKTTAAGILDFSKTSEFKKEAREFELSNRSLDEQVAINKINKQIVADRETQSQLRQLMMQGEGRSIYKTTSEYDPLTQSTYIKKTTVAQELLSINKSIRDAAKKKDEILGDFEKEYMEHLNNNMTGAIENRDNLIQQKVDLGIEKKLQEDRAKTFRSVPEDPTATTPDGTNPVADILIKRGIDPKNIAYTGEGESDPFTENMVDPEANQKTFRQNLNQFGATIGLMGALTGKEEETAKIMAKVAQIQLLVAMYERAKMAFDAGGGPLAILKTFFLGPAGRDGGIMSSPGYRSFAGGGVAKGPNSGYGAVLHGTEAVVPLPNGRSIPVDMGKGKMSTNNTNITVNIAEGGSSAQVDADTGAELGKVINSVVQDRLEKEMRPGGLLGG